MLRSTTPFHVKPAVPRTPHQPRQHEPETTVLHGRLTQWRVIRDGWGVGELQLSEADARPPGDAAARLISITGSLVDVRAGDDVELVGSYQQHERYGQQFRVRSCTATRPAGADGVTKWLASRLPGIGDKRAQQMVDRFGDGDRLWRVLRDEPDRLCEIDGIASEQALRISAAYREVEAERESMVQLRGWGLTDGQIARCCAEWGRAGDLQTGQLATVVAQLKQNPYLLGQDVFGFGFVRADQIARRMGVAVDAEIRLQAGVAYQLDEAAQAGHVYVPGAALQRMTAELLGVEPALLGPAIKAAARARRLVRRGWRVYSARMDRAEETCAVAIRALLDRGAA